MRAQSSEFLSPANESENRETGQISLLILTIRLIRSDNGIMLGRQQMPLPRERYRWVVPQEELDIYSVQCSGGLTD